MPRNWTAHQNHQPLTQWNKPSYYKHNHAYYRASVILVPLPSKTRIRLIKVGPSLYHTPFLFFNPCKVNVFRWCRSPSARATQPARRPGLSHLQDLWVSEAKLWTWRKPGGLSHQVPVRFRIRFLKRKTLLRLVFSGFFSG